MGSGPDLRASPTRGNARCPASPTVSRIHSDLVGVGISYRHTSSFHQKWASSSGLSDYLCTALSLKNNRKSSLGMEMNRVGKGNFLFTQSTSIIVSEFLHKKGYIFVSFCFLPNILGKMMIRGPDHMKTFSTTGEAFDLHAQHGRIGDQRGSPPQASQRQIFFF